MPRSPEDNELIRSARREEILRAAGRVFAKKGFAATKIADIAGEAGLSHGLLYHYFRSKEAVYTALLREMIDRKPSRAAVIGDARTAMERVERAVGHWLKNVAERPEIAVLLAQAFLADTLPKDVRAAFLRFVRDYYRDLVADLRAAQAEGTATRDVSAEELAVTIVATMRGIALVRFVYAAVTPLEVMPSLDTVLRIVRAGTRTERSSPLIAVVSGREENGRRAAKEVRRALRA